VLRYKRRTHKNHYLMTLAKRHLANEACNRLNELEVKELKEVRDMCKEVSNNYHY